MKFCTRCNLQAEDDHVACARCGNTAFAPQPVQPIAQPMPQQVVPKVQKPPFTWWDLLSILGFVSSIVGIFAVSIILHPIAVLASTFGFRRGSRFRGLAATGFILSIVAGVVSIVISLWQADIIPHWITEGIFH